MTLNDNQFKNVYDFKTAQKVKKMTGTGKAIPIPSGKGEPLTRKSRKHIKDMLKLNAPPKPTYSKWQKTLGNALGLDMSE